MFRWIRIVFVVLTFAVTWAYAALPGHHRALTPEFFGLFLIENGIYTDAPERHAEFEALLDTAQARAQGFFVGAKAPRIFICTSQECADRFDLKLRGLTLGRHLVFLGPKGLNEMILTHEFAHIHLHSRMGVQDVFHQDWPRICLAIHVCNLSRHDRRLGSNKRRVFESGVVCIKHGIGKRPMAQPRHWWRPCTLRLAM